MLLTKCKFFNNMVKNGDLKFKIRLNLDPIFTNYIKMYVFK